MLIDHVIVSNDVTRLCKTYVFTLALNNPKLYFKETGAMSISSNKQYISEYINKVCRCETVLQNELLT